VEESGRRGDPTTGAYEMEVAIGWRVLVNIPCQVCQGVFPASKSGNSGSPDPALPFDIRNPSLLSNTFGKLNYMSHGISVVASGRPKNAAHLHCELHQ